MKSVSIIGGGISGLCTGILASLKGYEVTIYEKNKYLGGGYKASIDYGFANNYIMIGEEDSNIRRKLSKIISFDNIELMSTEYIYSYKLGEENLFIYSDLKRLERHLLDLSPFDKNNIGFLIDGCKLVESIDFSFEKTKKTFFKDKNSKNYEHLYNKFGKITIEEYAQRFNSELIKNALKNFINPKDSLVKLVLIIGLYTTGRLIYVKNSEDILNNLINKFNELNGKIECGEFVKKIDIDNCIIQLENKKVKSDYIINSADIYEFNTELMNNKNITLNNKFFFDSIDTCNTNSLFVIDYIVNGIKSNYYFSWKNDKVFRVGSKENDNFKVFVRDNKLSVIFKQDGDDFEFFKILFKNNNVYKNEINRIVNDVTMMIEDYFLKLGFSKKEFKIKFEKCITPFDFYEEFKMYKGNIEGFKLSPKAIGASLNSEVKNYDNVFCINGSLMQPGWLFSCFMMALNYIDKYLIEYKNDKTNRKGREE